MRRRRGARRRLAPLVVVLLAAALAVGIARKMKIAGPEAATAAAKGIAYAGILAAGAWWLTRAVVLRLGLLALAPPIAALAAVAAFVALDGWRWADNLFGDGARPDKKCPPGYMLHPSGICGGITGVY